MLILDLIPKDDHVQGAGWVKSLFPVPIYFEERHDRRE